MTTPDTTQKNTSAFFLQAAAAFGVSLFAMVVAIYYLPADPWVKAFLALGTMFLTTSSFTLAKCVRDAQEDQMVVRRARPGPPRPGARQPRPVQERGLTPPATIRSCPCPIPQSSSSSAPRGRASPRGRPTTTAAPRSSPPTTCAASSAPGPPTSTPRPTPSTCSSAIVAARLGRGLTTVIDTLGLDADRRRAWLTPARAAGLPAVAVVLDTPGDECRRRNAAARPPGPGAGPGRPGTPRGRRVRDDLARRGLGRRRGRRRWRPHHRGSVPNRNDTPAEPAVGDQTRVTLALPRAAGGAPAVPVPVGRGPGRLAAGRWRWRPTRRASPGSR